MRLKHLLLGLCLPALIACSATNGANDTASGMDAVKADLVGVKNTADIVARLKAFAPNPKSGEWIIAQGWDEGYFGSAGYPDRALIDEAFPDNPIKMESLHGFGGFYNGAALAIAGIDKDTPEPEVGNILRRKNGEPTGVMLTLAQGLVNKHVPPYSFEDRKTAIRAGLLKMGLAGVTSIHEAGMTPEDVGKSPILISPTPRVQQSASLQKPC